jgi:cyclopropane-fatty-acyl-phospholipid synthase
MFLLSRLLKRSIRAGTLKVIDASGRLHVFGGAELGPAVTFRLTERSLPRRLVFSPDLALGEAYTDGSLQIEDGSLHDLLRVFHLNRASFAAHPAQAILRRVSRALKIVQPANNLFRARRNVAHHYDLSRELYELFLDEDMQYSCAYFTSPDVSLEQAQRDKKRHIAAKLVLKPGQSVLDIGCGWGGLAIYLASVADVEVTGVTLSEEQHKVAVERAQTAGVADRVRFELCDYRELPGRFDRIVSIGMFEHVGAAHYDEFFTRVGELLTDDGVMLLHSIGRMTPPGSAGPWIRKYIFPGGYTPAVSEVFAATERQRLWVTDVEILRLHYAETLKAWNARFQANRAQAARLYNERFCRLWEYYLAVAEMAFRLGNNQVFQMQLAKDRAAVPLTRDYIGETEKALEGTALRLRVPEADVRRAA